MNDDVKAYLKSRLDKMYRMTLCGDVTCICYEDKAMRKFLDDIYVEMADEQESNAESHI